MRNYKLKGLILCLILLITSISLILSLQLDISNDQNDTNVGIEIKNFIYINGNNQLNNTATSGNGTINNPYIIDNQVINSSGEGIPSIMILNTDAYFEIRNFTILETDMSALTIIFLHNVSYGTIKDSIIEDPSRDLIGIYLNDSQNNIIENNTIYDVATGINLAQDSQDNQILNNTVAYSHYSNGILVSDSDENLIENNTIKLCDYDQTAGNFRGIYVDKSHNTTLKGNVIKHSYGENSLAIQLSHSNYSKIIDNLIHNNTALGITPSSLGIYLDRSNFTLISGNSINYTNSNSDSANCMGIGIYFSINNTIINNRINNTVATGSSAFSYGVRLYASNYTDIAYNVITNNYDYGINIFNSHENKNTTWNQIYNHMQNYFETGGSSGNVPMDNDYHSYKILTNAALSEMTGNVSTNFNFTITYTDLGNNPPSFVKVLIDGVSNSMQIVNSSDYNYTDGVDFIYSTSLTEGLHEYHFEASNGSDSERIPRIWENSGPTVLNSPPSLSNGGVSPLIGNESTTFFTFSVNYFDIDNDEPNFVRVFINSTSFNMTKQGSDDDYTDGCTYIYSTNLTAGNYTYYFTAHDGIYPVIDPEPGIYQGPCVLEKESTTTTTTPPIPGFEFIIIIIGLISLILTQKTPRLKFEFKASKK